MSLLKLDNGWMQYGKGIKWRCKAPGYFCEVQNEGNVPVYSDAAIMTRIREVRNFYSTRIKELGLINSFGYGIDILVANTFAESGGKVPSPLNTPDLQRIYDQATGDAGSRLDQVARYVKGSKNTANLIRLEPGYSNPVTTPNKISMGAHHHLISTALWLQGKSGNIPAEQVRDVVQRLPSDSKYAATLAVAYFNKSFSKHQNQPPMMAACYNAGSPRESGDNIWNLRSTNDHIDRWVKYFNMSRRAASGAVPPVKTTAVMTRPATVAQPSAVKETVLPAPSVNNVNTTSRISVEGVLSALRKKNYAIREADDKEYNLNLVGIRHNSARVNFFDDILFVFWKYKGQWFSKSYNITTYPGLAYLGEKPGNRLGTAILKEGQYPGSHRVGFHNMSKPTKYEALVQRGKLTVYRDNNHDGKFNLRPESLDTGSGFGVNIHRGKSAGITLNVGPYSAGCQVFGRFEQWTEFHNLFKKAEANWGGSFTYTLINYADIG